MIARYGWRTSFWLAAAGTAMLALAWHRNTCDYPNDHPSIADLSERSSREAVRRARNRHGRTPWRQLLTDRNLMLLTTGYFAVCYFDYLFFYWIYYYFGEVRHIEPTRTAVYTAALFLTWTVMTPLGGWVSDRLVERCGRKAGRRLVPIVGLALSALLLGWGATVSRPAAAASLGLGFASATDGPFWAAAIDMGGAHVGAAGGVLNMGGTLGGFFAPIITPFIASYFGWSSGLYSAGLIVMLGVLVWFFVDPTKAIASE
jgi:MFS transporter, ACS family, D-galactonate transporter